MEKRITVKDGWKYCFRAARKANRHYKTAREYATPIGEIETAAYYFMLASKAIQDANTGHQLAGSVYARVTPEGYMFTVYTYNSKDGLSKRHAFKFRFGETTTENNDAYNNRHEWQRQAQAVERIAEMRNAKHDIARLLNGMNDEDFFKAYATIKTIVKATR